MSAIYTSADQLIGKTPLLELTHIEKELGLKAKILAKLEYFNPAGSVKDRIAKAMMPLVKMPRISTPVTTPHIFPSPPMKDTPPRMAAVMQVNSVPGPVVDAAEPVLANRTNADNATRNPQKVNTNSLIHLTLIPARCAAS